MAVAAVEEPAKGVVKVCVALANRWVVTIELPHPEAVHRARGATGDAYSILSDEAREAVDMEPMHPELFEADAVDFYIPGTLPCTCTTNMPPCFIDYRQRACGMLRLSLLRMRRYNQLRPSAHQWSFCVRAS